MSDLLVSKVGPAGIRSPRSYTPAEVAAARRRGLAHGKRVTDELSGPIFWATGDWTPNEVRAALADYELLAKAIEREWGKPWDEAES